MAMPVDVWWARPGDSARDLAPLLDDVERSRAAAYVHEADRSRFVVGAALVRCAVGRYAGRAPQDVRLDRTCEQCGRPHGRVRTPDTSLSVSVSHAGDAVAVAVAAEVAIGVDVEPVDHSDDNRAVARASLTASEWRSVEALSGDEFSRAFVQRWVAKEAVLKASGDGLRLPMSGLELDGSGPPFAVRAWAERPELAGRARLWRLHGAPAGHEACLAVLDGPADLVVDEHPGGDLLASFGIR